MKENYQDLKTAATRISEGNMLAEELLHYCIEEFLRKPDVSAILASGGGRFYIVRMMMNQWKSVTSPFYHTYRKPTETITEEHEDIPAEMTDESLTEVSDRIKSQLDVLSWYDKMLFDTFVTEGHTVSSLSRATGIPRTSISLTINRIRRHIKKNI